MRDITVKKEELLEALKGNRKAHAIAYEEAMEGYQETVIEELEETLEAVRTGDVLTPQLYFDEPRSHVDDYDRVIGMLEMEVSDTVVLSEQEFAQFVQDQWNWKGDFLRTQALYVGKKMGR